MSVARGELGTVSTPIVTEEYAACSVDLDINTVPENTEPIPAERLIELYDELLALGAEIAEKGDIQ